MKASTKIIAAGAFALGCVSLTAPASAALVITSVVGGVPTGASYVNFDNLALGAAGGMSGGVGVSFSTDGQIVSGTASTYAAPYISNSNGMLFGDSTVSGPDSTRFVTTGVGSATLTMPGTETYLGLLWGSVDLYNTLQFYNGSTLVGTATGADVTAAANGNQGASGTYYVNILSDLGFDSVVASSSEYAFEFDNVAYNPTNPNNPVPEPFSLGLVGLGMVGIAAGRRRLKHGVA
jgi:hypothetical protein